MAELPALFYVHRVAVQPFLGSGAYGDTFGEPVEFPAWVEQKRRYVAGEGGAQLLSEAVFKCDMEHAAHTAPGSLVTLHTEIAGVPLQERRVLSQAYHTDGGLGAWQHLEVTL